MKLFFSLVSFLAASHVTLGSPLGNSAVLSTEEKGLEIRSTNSLHTLEGRDNGCLTLDGARRGIKNLNSNSVNVPFLIAKAGVLASLVCSLSDSSKCVQISFVVSTALEIIYFAADKMAGSDPAPIPNPARARGVHLIEEDQIQRWNAILGNLEGLSYDSLDSLPFNTTLSHLNRRNGQPALLHKLQMTGVKRDNNTPKHDIIANYYDNGQTMLHLPIPDEKGSLNKRTPTSKPGFKISYKTKETSSLSRKDSQTMSNAVADRWAKYADDKSLQMSEFIGFAEDGHDPNFYFRIIPEKSGFGDNYEDVDVCGSMAKFL